MRISICFRHAGSLHRILWVNESRDGVYHGHAGGGGVYHESWHTDGTRHHELNGVRSPNPYSWPAMKDVDRVYQMSHVFVTVDPRWAENRPAYQGDQRTETIVVLDESLFSAPSRCGVDLWVMSRDTAGELRRILAGGRDDFKLLRFLSTSLDYFPHLEVALSYWDPVRLGPSA